MVWEAWGGDVDGEKFAEGDDGRDANRQPDQHQGDAGNPQPMPAWDTAGKHVTNPLGGEDGPKESRPTGELRSSILNVGSAAASPHNTASRISPAAQPYISQAHSVDKTHPAPRTFQKRYHDGPRFGNKYGQSASARLHDPALWFKLATPVSRPLNSLRRSTLAMKTFLKPAQPILDRWKFKGSILATPWSLSSQGRCALHARDSPAPK